jgi:pimeloyl-ACP methyl ester carboxylesterase
MITGCICLHGFGENRNTYQIFQNELKVLPVTCIDLPGHGSNRQETYQLGKTMAYIDECIQNSGYDQVILVGTSFGGIASYIFASDNQTEYVDSRDKIIGLIINDVPCCVPAASFKLIANSLLYLSNKTYFNLADLNQDYIQLGFKKDREPISKAHWKHFLEASLDQTQTNYDPKFIEALLSKEAGIETIAPQVEFKDISEISVLDLRYYWAAISKPMLLFIGERTTFFPQFVRDITDLNPLVSQIEIENGGHFLDLARPEILGHMREWISDILLKTFPKHADCVSA